jgi:TctA family transporter
MYTNIASEPHLRADSRLVFCCIGVYSVSNSVFDVFVAGFFCIVGVVLRQRKCHPAPLVLTLVFTPMLEENFRRAMIISKGAFSAFVTHPVSAGILVLTVALAVFFLYRKPGSGSAH